ncbi:zinc-dependent alcohol dehydrogenase family protein [bacterium]|nr:zinc-dependent alcohol dehydrogenase family protein [bacterium]MBU1983002.1 zinc-dependent alcohol dehydrogenase family protein [bacterium]
MRTWILEKPAPIEKRPLKLVQRPVPDPARGEVRIKVLVCAMCRTDLHTVEGDIPHPRLPITPGHQVVGIIDRLGEGVTGPAVGARVGVPWLASTCGTCSYCAGGRENLCDNGKFTGQHVDGGYAEYMIARADFVYPIPEGFDEIHAAPLLCSGVIGYRAYRLADLPPGGRLGLYGFGSSAHVTIQVARYLGHECYVITRGQAGQEHARRLGAVWAGGSDDTPPDKLDSVIIFAPAGELIPRALTHLRKGGVVTCAGIHISPIPEFPYEILWGERVIRSVANSTREDVRQLLHLASDMNLQPDVVLFDFEHLNDHLLALKRGEFVGSGVIRMVHRSDP